MDESPKYGDYPALLSRRCYGWRSNLCISERTTIIVIKNLIHSIEIFNTKTERFKSEPKMPMALSGMAAVVIRKYIVAIGGYDSNGNNIKQTLLFDTGLLL